MARHYRRSTSSLSDSTGCLIGIFGLIGSIIALLFLSEDPTARKVGWSIIGFFAVFYMFTSSGVTGGWSMIFALLVVSGILLAIAGVFKSPDTEYQQSPQSSMPNDFQNDNNKTEDIVIPKKNVQEKKSGLFGRKKKNNTSASGTQPVKSKIIKYFAIAAGCFIAFCVIFSVIKVTTHTGTELEAASVNASFAVEESADGTYIGEIVNGVYSGQGEFRYLSEATYSGKYEDSQRSGKGTYTWPNGDSYTGTWEDDNMRYGKYTFADGRYYEGSFDRNHYDNGDYYLGKACAANGYSEFHATIKNQQVEKLAFKTTAGLTYVGELSGNANITYTSGNTYSGIVDNGIRSGKGTFKWFSNGTMTAYYEGDWINDIMDGQGIYHYTQNQYPYLMGMFKQGKPEGNLTYYKEAENAFDTVWSNGAVTSIIES